MRVNKTRKKGLRVKKANQGMVVGDPTPDNSDQMQKSQEAMDFLKLLYGDQHARDIINRNLRYDGRNNYRVAEDEYGNTTYPDYTPQMWLEEHGSNIDISQDVPAFMAPTLGEFLKIREGGIRHSTLEDFRDPYDFVTGFDNKTQKLQGHLRRMFPERETELQTYEGLANAYADMMGDFSASMGNMKFDSDDDEYGSAGYGSDGYVKRVRRNTGFHPNEMHQYRDGDHDYPRGKSIYEARQDRLGFRDRPYTMGMGKYQDRMNEAIQIDPGQDMGTFVHEMTHAGDIEANSFNNSYIESAAKRVFNDEEQMEMLNDRSWDYGSDSEDFWRYVTTPTETLARLNQLRYAMYKHFGSEDTPYKAEDFVNYTYGTTPRKEVNIFMDNEVSRGAYEDLVSIYGQDAILDMLNNVY